jgi:predicted PurR-regulated permease PerM
MFSKRAATIQDQFKIFVTDLARKIMTHDPEFKKEVFKIFDDHKALLVKDLNEEQVKEFQADQQTYWMALYDAVIENTTISLPKPDETTMKAQSESFETYKTFITSAVDTVISIAWQNEIRVYLSQLDLQSVLKDENLMAVIKKVAPQLWNILNGSISVIIGTMAMVIVFLYLIFILIDYEKVTKGMFDIIPGKYRGLITEIIQDLEQGMNRYFRGQALVAIIVSVLFCIGFSIVGLPLAIAMGLFLGVLNLVPYLKTIAIVPGTFLAFLQSVETGQSFLSVMLWLVAIFMFIQVIEDMFLVPKIMGKVTGLNPAIILLSLSVWGSLMGMIGLIIALPLTTLIISYYKRFVLNEKKVEEDNINQPDEIDLGTDKVEV